MIKYKVIKDPSLERYDISSDEILTLVNTKDNTDRIMAAPDEFTINEIVDEDEIYLEERQYTDEDGFWVGWFAFKIDKQELITNK